VPLCHCFTTKSSNRTARVEERGEVNQFKNK